MNTLFLFLFLTFVTLVNANPSVAVKTQQSKDKLTFAVLDTALTEEDARAVNLTIEELKKKLYPLEIEIHNYNPSDLAKQLAADKVDYFFGTSGFYRRHDKFALTPIATLFTKSAPNPRHGSGAVFVVLRDSPFKKISDLRGKTAIASWSAGFSSFYVPMGEITKQGFDADNFFGQYRTFGPPVQNLLSHLENHEGDVCLLRACVLEDMSLTDKDVWKKFRVLEEKKDGYLKCKHSTDLYPNWTLFATGQSNWKTTREITKIMLSISEDRGFGWSIVPDFQTVDHLYRTLKRGPYEYLRVQSIEDFFYKYRFLFVILLISILLLLLHSWRADQLVRNRTESLRKAWEKERKLRRQISQSEARIQQLQKVEIIGAMSSLIAHDINGPLATIENYSRGLRRRLEHNDENGWIEKPLAAIERQTHKISEIVARVRSYAKRETQSTENINVTQALRQYVTNFTVRYPQADIHIGTLQTAIILGHPFEFEVVIENLLKNAIQAALQTENSKVIVESFLHEQTISIQIKNAANVCSADQLNSCFRPFSSTKEKGFGMGLLICKTIVEKMRGQILFNYENGWVCLNLILPIENNHGANDVNPNC